MFKIAVVLIGAVLIGAAIYVFPRESEAPSPTTQSTETMPASPQANNQADGQGTYIDYQDNIISQTPGQKILFFHAPWCPQCRALEADIEKGPIPEGVTIIKTDFDSMQELRQKYGVTLQTTLVKVDDQGTLVKKYVAYDAPTLDSLINNLL